MFFIRTEGDLEDVERILRGQSKPDGGFVVGKNMPTDRNQLREIKAIGDRARRQGLLAVFEGSRPAGRWFEFFLIILRYGLGEVLSPAESKAEGLNSSVEHWRVWMRAKEEDSGLATEKRDRRSRFETDELVRLQDAVSVHHPGWWRWHNEPPVCSQCNPVRVKEWLPCKFGDRLALVRAIEFDEGWYELKMVAENFLHGFQTGKLEERYPDFHDINLVFVVVHESEINLV